MATYSPIVYDSTAKAHIILASGQPIDPSHIMVSSEEGNLLKSTAAGLSVKIDSVISSDPDNLLRVVDGKLIVTFSADSGGVISGDSGNYIRYGLDHGVFLDGNDVLSNGAENLLYIDGTDGKVILTRESLKDAGFVDASGLRIVSGDANNLIVAGTDGGAYLDEARVPTGVSSDSNNLLTRGSDGKPYLSASAIPSVVSTAAGNLITDVNGAFLSGMNLLGTASDNMLKTDVAGKIVLDEDDVKQLVTDTVNPASLISSSYGNAITIAGDGKLMVAASSLRSSDADNAITIGADGKLYAPKVSAADLTVGTDLILGVNSGGKLFTTLGANYDITTGNLTLIGQGSQTVATVNIPSSGSVLESAQIVVNPAGQPAGTYLAMTFKKGDGTTFTVYADLSALGDVYTGGNGVNIDPSTRVITVKLAAAGGLEFDANGAIKLNATALDPVSGDSDNLIQIGTDGKAYLPSDFGTM